jgi:hypothetical protein
MPYESGKLTPEEIEPGPEDIELATRLVSEGWQSVSNKYRTVRRWTTQHIPVKELIRPELLETPEAKWWIDKAKGRLIEPWLRMADTSGLPFEEMELTVRQYRAFRLAGGESA